MSWQMMLRSKTGKIEIEVVDKATNDRSKVNLRKYLSYKQRISMAGEPDLIWQFAQRLKQEYEVEGKDIAVFANSNVSLNGHPSKPLIDPKVDLASVPWEPLNHSVWILTHD
jgi:hypothetical protein